MKEYHPADIQRFFETNTENKIRYMNKKCSDGDTDAMNILGGYYEYSEDIELAMKYYRMAIDLKDPVAMYNIARIYTCEQDYRTSISYLSLAKKYGFEKISFAMGFNYYLSKNFELMNEYMIKAINEDKNCISRIISLFVEKEEKDLAYKYILIGSMNGLEEAIDVCNLHVKEILSDICDDHEKELEDLYNASQ